VVAVGAAGLVAVRLVAVTARTVTQDVLAQQADVVAAQLAETGGGLRGGAGMRRVVDVLAGQGVTVVVVTARGARNPGVLGPVLQQAGVDRALGGQPVSAQVVSGGVRYLVEARPAPVGGFALVRTSDTGPLGGGLVRRNLTVALLAGVAVAVVVGLVVGQLLARPLRRTAVAARLLRSGRRDVRVPVAGPTEVSAVAGAVNELADALAHSEERQRLFLLSVSHELRTPLTAVRGFAESLADGVVTGNDATDAGRVIVREADRLDRLVGDLMELARLEADDFRLDPVPVDLAALAADAAPVWAARCTDAGVRFAVAAARRWSCGPIPDACGRSSTGSPRTRCASPPVARRSSSPPGATPPSPGCRSATAVPASRPRTIRSSSSAGCCTTATGDAGRSARRGRTRAGARAGRAHGGDGRRRTRARGRSLLHRHVPGRRPHRQAVNCTIRIALPKGSRRPKSVP
jgi:signal transduction histidine kinase